MRGPLSSNVPCFYIWKQSDGDGQRVGAAAQLGDEINLITAGTSHAVTVGQIK